jgi:hypothetical protein
MTHLCVSACVSACVCAGVSACHISASALPQPLINLNLKA